MGSMALIIRRATIFATGAVVLCAVLGLVQGVEDPKKNDFHFSILGDRTSAPQPEIYGRVWREVDLLHPDFVMNVGDTIEGGNDATVEQEWAAIHSIWKRYPYPLYLTPGNHDLYSEKARQIYEKQAGHPPFYSFNWQNAHFTVLDVTAADELPDAQLNFLKRDLEANKDKSPKLILFHRPYWIVMARVHNREFPLHQIAKKYGVSYVICGHAHQWMRMVNDGVVYMVVGSSGANMRRGMQAGQGFKEGWFFGHVWVHVNGSQVEMTIKEIDGKGQGRMFRAEDWDEHGPKFNPADPAASEGPAT
jgi:hypothetical protein